MKIGILTHPLGRNYGGILQAWALQQVVKELGYRPQTIDWDYNIYSWKSFYRGLPGAFCAKLLGEKVQWPPNPNWIPKKYQGLRSFVKRNICLSPRISFNAIIPYINSHYHIVIVGSDQVWRVPYIPRIETMFLPYSKRKGSKKIAYAASFGTDDWEYSSEQTLHCQVLLQDFDAIGVREKSGVTLCENKFGISNVKWVLDPTLLLDADYYNSLCQGVKTEYGSFVFAYILDPNPQLLELARRKAEDMKINLKIVSVDNEVKPEDTVDRWLAYFRDAKYVITDSFHGTVFSLIYHKEFAVYKNATRGTSRFDSLINLLPPLKGRIINETKCPKADFDWESVDAILSKQRLTSIEFLKNALNNF